MKTRIAILLSLLILFGSFGESQGRRPVTRISEGDVLESLGLEVKFSRPVLRTARGVSRASLDDVTADYEHIRSMFLDLASRFGAFTLFKEIPEAEWGDTLKSRIADGELVRVNDMSQLYYLQFSEYIPVDTVIAVIQQVPEVEYAHPPALAVSLADPPNDPLYSSQWNLAKVAAEGAWQVTIGSPSIRVAIIEDGQLPERDHPDLVNKWAPGIGEQGPGSGSHGTRVAGIVGAETGNGSGISSLGRGLNMSRYFFSYEEPEPITLAAQIRRAADENNVINCSFLTVRLYKIPGTTCWIRQSTDYQ